MKRNMIAGLTILSIVLALILFYDGEFQTLFDKKKSDTENSENKPKVTNVTKEKSPGFDVTYVNTSYVKEYSLPDGTWPNGILVDKNGMVWAAGSRSHTLISFDTIQNQIKSSYEVTEGIIPNDNLSQSFMVWSMVQDNDGFIWLSQFGPHKLWRFDPKIEKFSAFSSVSASPYQMKVERGTGNIWFTTLTGNTLGVIQKIDEKDSELAYKITEFNLGDDTYPAGLFLEKNHVWITQIQSHKLARFDVSKESDVINITNKFEIPSGEKRLYSSTDVLVLDDNSLWFTEHGTSTVTRYDVDSQTLTRFPTSASPYQTTTLPFWVRQSADGKGFWFNEHTGNRIAFFNTADMTLTEYEIPTRPSDGYVVYPLGIAVDSKDSNKLWFSEWNTDKIAVVDRSAPLSFDIHSNVDRIVLSGFNDTANIDVEISKNNVILSNNTTVFLKTSSSMESAGGFVNMTATFTTNTINLKKINETTHVNLLLQNNFAPVGNYTVAISVTDGTVTRSVFLDLVVE